MTEALIRIRPGVPPAQASTPVTFDAITDSTPIIDPLWDAFYARLSANYGLPTVDDQFTTKKHLWRSLAKQGWGMLDAELRTRLDVITGHLATEGDSKLNWLTDDFGDLVNNGAAWTTTYGWAPDGASTYVSAGFQFTGLAPQKATSTSAHFSVYVTDFAVGDSDMIVGRDSGADEIRLNPGATSGTKLVIQLFGASQEIDYEGPWTGHWLVTRTGTTLRAYRDGVQVGSDITGDTFVSLPGGTITFGKNGASFRAFKFVGTSFGMHVSVNQARRIKAFHEAMHTLASYIAAL